MFQFGSLRFRIFAIVGCICAGIVLTTGVGYWGQTSTLASFEDYRAIEDYVTNVNAIDADVQELRRQVGEYVATANVSQEESVRRILKQLDARIVEELARSHDEETRDHLERMTPQLEQYTQNFESAVQERRLRADFLQVQLPRQSAETQTAMDNIARTLLQNEDNDNLVLVLSAQQSALLAQQHTLQYFAAPDSLLAEQAIEAFEQADRQLGDVQLADEALNEQVSSLRRQLAENERQTYRAIQATRGYLYLTNVVMAGAASEIIWHASEMKAQAAEQSREINAQTKSNVQLATWGVTFSLLVAMLAAFAAAFGLVHSITRPIASLTETFRELAAGKTLESFPERDRQDEIGEMSKAALVFSEKNQQTERLLAQSREMTQQLEQKSSELKAINAELDNFAYVASHDLKTPLRGIKQLAGWVKEDATEALGEESSKHLEMLMKRIEKMNVLLDELLQYSRIGRIEAEPEEVALEPLIRESIELLDTHAGVDIRLGGELPVVKTLKAPLAQVIQNLLSNALKYNDRGDKGWVEIHVESAGAVLQITVADNGPGIDPSNHERIFQMYQRVDNRKIDGTGMGLAIVKRQIESVGGTIRVESELGEGASFTFSWPREMDMSLGHEAAPSVAG